MKLTDITVEVRDKTLARVGMIPYSDLNLKANTAFNNVGDWTIEIATEHPLAEALRTPGAGIIVTTPEDVLFSGPADTHETKATVTDPNGTLTVSGVTDDHILSDYLSWPEPSNPDITSQTVAHDERTGAAETLMHAYVSANVGPTAALARRNMKLTMGTDQGRGPVLTKKPRFPVLGNLLNEISLDSGLGFRIVQRGDVLVFETYAMRDQTKLVRLDIKNNSLAGHRIAVSAPTATRVFVAGQDQGVNRKFLAFTNQDALDAEDDWGRRIERFLDQRQTNDNAELQRAAVELLAQEGFTSIDGQVVPMEDSPMELGKDWNLGDNVSVVLNGIELATPVTGIALKADSTAFNVGAVLGKPYVLDADAAKARRLAIADERLRRIETGSEIPLGGSTDTVAPDRPTGLTGTSDVYFNPFGFAEASVSLSWTAPSTNSDGSGLQDLAGYDVYRLADSAANTADGELMRTVHDTTVTLGLQPVGVWYKWYVVAFDTSGNRSAKSDLWRMQNAADATPPPIPSTPTVTAYLGQIKVDWDELDSFGAPMPRDFAYMEVHAYTTSGFTPTDATIAAKIPFGAKTAILTDLPYGTTYYVKLIAVDNSGNRSQASGEASATPVRVSGLDVEALAIETSNLGDGAVTASKIKDATITSAKIGTAQILNANIANAAVDNAKIGSVSAGKITAGTLSASVILSGSISTSTSGNRVTMTNGGLFAYDAYGSLTTAIYANGGYTYLRGDIYANTFRSQGYGTSGYGYIEIGDTGPYDPTDEIRMFYGSTVSSMRNPSDRPGVVRWVTKDNGAKDYNLSSSYGFESQRFSSAYSPSQIFIDMTSAGISFQSTSMSDVLRIDGVYQGGSYHCRLRYMYPGAGALKFLGSGAVVQVRDSSDGSYGTLAAANVSGSSSIHVKHDITDIDSPLAKVMGAPAKRWKYLPGFAVDDRHRFGPMAEQVPPELQVVMDDQGTLGIDAFSAIGLLWGAVQELATKTGHAPVTPPVPRKGANP